MGRLFVCAAFCLFLSTNMWASTEIDLTPAELLPAKTSFAYKARHSNNPLPGPALTALWFSGDDRELPRVTVAEPIMVAPAETARAVPSKTALCSHAAAVAAEHNLPGPFFANLIQQESGFKSHVVSPAGAQGIAQFMPRVARAYGLENPFDPLHSLAVSAKFLRELLGQFGNLGLAAAAYNAGPRRVQDWMAKRGRLPEETRTYVRNITGQPAERWARVNARTEEARLPAHARCPGMPVIEVSVPEAAPVRIAKKGGKGTTKIAKIAAVQVADASDELPNLAAAKAVGPKMPKSFMLASATPSKSVKLASIARDKQVALIRNSKIQIMVAERASKAPVSKKPAAERIVIAAKDGSKSAGKAVAKSAARGATKTAANTAAKTKSADKPPGAKRVKLAAAR
jgi:hypothetical protein